MLKTDIKVETHGDFYAIVGKDEGSVCSGEVSGGLYTKSGQRVIQSCLAPSNDSGYSNSTISRSRYTRYAMESNGLTICERWDRGLSVGNEKDGKRTGKLRLSAWELGHSSVTSRISYFGDSLHHASPALEPCPSQS